MSWLIVPTRLIHLFIYSLTRYFCLPTMETVLIQLCRCGFYELWWNKFSMPKKHRINLMEGALLAGYFTVIPRFEYTYMLWTSTIEENVPVWKGKVPRAWPGETKGNVNCLCNQFDFVISQSPRGMEEGIREMRRSYGRLYFPKMGPITSPIAQALLSRGGVDVLSPWILGGPLWLS